MNARMQCHRLAAMLLAASLAQAATNYVGTLGTPVTQ